MTKALTLKTAEKVSALPYAVPRSEEFP